MAGPGIESTTSGLQVRRPTDCATRPAVNVTSYDFSSSNESKIRAHDAYTQQQYTRYALISEHEAHIQQQYTRVATYHMSDLSKPKKLLKIENENVKLKCYSFILILSP